MYAFRIASILALVAAASDARADCDLRFAPPEVRAAAAAHRVRNGNSSVSPAATLSLSPFEKGGLKGDLLSAPVQEKQILPDPPGPQAQPAGVR